MERLQPKTQKAPIEWHKQVRKLPGCGVQNRSDIYQVSYRFVESPIEGELSNESVKFGLVSIASRRPHNGFEPGLYVFTNVTKADCQIKGNIRAGKKTYLLQTCTNYDQTIIDTSYGDRWFCTENEAKSAGFIKSLTCTKN